MTVTDFFGTERTIYIHDPPIVWERDHRHILRFAFEHVKGGAVRSDFDLYNVPSLAFAARATSAFPGAFPPVQIQEMDSVLSARRQSWPAREQFLRTNFRHYLEFNMNPENAILVDGSVLNNKPVFEAIEAASTHPAFGEVDRRLVYIDPHPGEEKRPIPELMPGFVQTIIGALSDLPRYEPIFNELSRIEIFNEKIRHLKAAIDSTTPRVQTLVEGVAGDKLDQPADATQVRQWRLQVAHCLSVDTALLYNNYMRLMIDAGLNFLARLICTICTYPQGSPRAHWVTKILRLWAQRIEIYRREYEIPPGVADDAELPPFARLVDTFDLTFRYRRIQFVMRAINRLYPRLQEPGCRTMTSSTLDALKRRLYQQLNSLRTYQGTGFLRTQTASA
ncbi:patatin-like protein [Massilia cavernae]|uniref:patatin-like protein n=1 Tax=Massilia cavernae TaxID=2320864 RepID=UPI0015FF1DCD|nr:patatin-like protein [Massilia cavernae]